MFYRDSRRDEFILFSRGPSADLTGEAPPLHKRNDTKQIF